MKNLIKKIKKFFKKDKGSMMIEAVVGLTLITIGMLGVFTLVTNSIRSSKVAGNRFVAANLGAEGVEIVKNIIDTNIAQYIPWNSNLSSGSYELGYGYDYNYSPLSSLSGSLSYLKFDGSNYQYDDGIDTIFQREIIVSNVNPDIVKIESVVIWEEKGKSKEITIEDHFYNWR